VVVVVVIVVPTHWLQGWYPPPGRVEDPDGPGGAGPGRLLPHHLGVVPDLGDVPRRHWGRGVCGVLLCVMGCGSWR